MVMTGVDWASVVLTVSVEAMDTKHNTNMSFSLERVALAWPQYDITPSLLLFFLKPSLLSFLPAHLSLPPSPCPPLVPLPQSTSGMFLISAA